MNTEGQITIRQWFALPKAERRARAEAFREADEALQAYCPPWREEDETYYRLNDRVGELLLTVPWWCSAPALPHVSADIARLAARMRAAARKQAAAPPCPYENCHHNHPERGFR